jgi:hypothetical protein
MSYESNTGLGVNNHYGPRELGNSAGIVGTQGREVELSIDLNEDVVSNGSPLLVDFTIPAGSIIENVYLEVTEAFDLGGTTPAIEVGTDTSEATNGFTIDEADAELAGVYDLTAALSGTWAAPLAADTVIGVALSGTTPTIVADTGKAKVIIKYTLTA